MVKLILIKKNRCTFDRITDFVVPLLHKPIFSDSILIDKLELALNDYIWSELEPHVTFIDIDIESGSDIMDIICRNLCACFSDKEPDDFFYLTESSYSTPKYFLEFVHAQPMWDDYEASQITNMNNIGCLMSLRHNVIENNCILIVNKYDLSMPKFVSMIDCAKEHLIHVIRSRYFHSAVLIKENTLVQYYFQNPVALVTELFNLNVKTDSIDTLSFTYLKYNLLFYFRQDKNSFINKCATRITAHNKIYGEALLFHEPEEKIFSNLDKDEVKRLNLLSYGRLSTRDLTKNEINDMTTINQCPTSDGDSGPNPNPNPNPVLWSKYLVSEKRFLTCKEINNKCLFCNSEIKKLIICSHCFRPRYCSEECCIRDFKKSHFAECIYD